MDEYGMGFDPDEGMGFGSRKPGFTNKGGLWFADAFTCGNYRTPGESPYGYGVHVTNGPIQEFKGPDIMCDYSDRLNGWHRDRWSKACKLLKSGGGMKAFAYADLGTVSKFLSIVYGFKVNCLQVLEGCNVGNGYPFVIFISKRVHKPRKKKTA